MNIIIDTHIFLSLIYDTKKIAPHHKSYLEDLNNTLYLSSISIAEIMIKKSIGNLNVDFDMFGMCEQMGIEILEFDGLSALMLGDLPYHHRDPFDRMIISQSITKKYKLISVDKKFEQYQCELL